MSTAAEVVAWNEVISPIGTFLVAARGHQIIEVRLPGTWSPSSIPGDWRRDGAVVEPAEVQLAEYFAGSRTAFDLELAPHGTTFQQSVWAALETIPYGATASYREIAVAVGNPNATRAVGMANNRNPIALVIPCHRVIGADGSLTGYGGGLEMKTWLLDHERTVVERGLVQAAGYAGSAGTPGPPSAHVGAPGGPARSSRR